MSNDKKLFAISGLFDTPDAIMSAAAKVAERDYKDWDVNTPYPVHGMDDAMKLPPSKLAWVTFAFSFAPFLEIGLRDANLNLPKLP